MSDDREIVRRLLEGGREAWDRFARDYRLIVLKAVHAAARRFSPVAADVEGAASEVFIELLKDDARALRAYKGESALTTWLSVITYRVACREFGRIRATSLDATNLAAPRRPGIDIFIDMEKLPERERRALVLFHIEGRSYREIGRELGVPENQVGMVLLRAREALQKILER